MEVPTIAKWISVLLILLAVFVLSTLFYIVEYDTPSPTLRNTVNESVKDLSHIADMQVNQ